MVTADNNSAVLCCSNQRAIHAREEFGLRLVSGVALDRSWVPVPALLLVSPVAVRALAWAATEPQQ